MKLIVIGYMRRCVWLVIQSRATLHFAGYLQVRPTMASRILAVRYNLCPHISAKKTVAAFHGTLKDVFEQNHPPLDCKNFSQKAENEAFGELSLDITVQDLDAFKINKLSFHCQARPAKSTEGAECDVDNIAPPLPNAFAILMGVTSEFVPKKTNRYSFIFLIARSNEYEAHK